MNGFLLILFSSIVFVYGDFNCSTYDPCGPYGYCQDTEYGNWSCTCKFWWNGTLCNEQTNSGKQVIALGCLVGFLMILFYGLQITLCIRNKRKTKSKENEEKTEIKNLKLTDLALKTAYQSARLPSCITFILTIIIASSGLLGKWALIQSIHNEIIDKYRTNQSIYYTQNSFCELISMQQFNVITFPVACFLIIICILRTKRVSLLRYQCHGYGAPPIPIDFLSYFDRKFAAVVFAICADELLTIMNELINGSSTSDGDTGIIIIYLKRLLQVLFMGFRYYPILAAVYLNTILTLSTAMIYAWLDYAVSVVILGMCQSDYYPIYDDYIDDPDQIKTYLQYYGIGPNLVVIQLCTDIPRFLCLAYISVKLPILLIQKIYKRFRKNLTKEEEFIEKLTREEQRLFQIIRPTSVEMLYVKNLFRSADQRPPSQALIARLIPKKIYEWRDDFRFSARILCVYASIFLLLYFVAIQACVQVLPYLDSFQQSCQELVNVISSFYDSSSSSSLDTNSTTSVDPNTTLFPFPPLVRPYLFAVFITLIIIIIQLLIFLVNLRRNLFQLYRGNETEIPRRLQSRNVSFSSGNVHFAGYFIGYLVWGFIIIAVFVSIICISIQAFITYGSVQLVEKTLKAIIPSLLFVLFKQYLNQILAQYVFLQHYGQVLSINNRRLLMIFIYFNFFFDAFLGFISSIVRLIKSVIGGIAYMARLDYSPLGRKLETMDGGFSAYCGFVHTECAHRHPVLLVFLAHLYTQYKIKKQLTINFDDSKQRKTSERYIRKWKLAVFLIRNPTIVFFRKAYLNQFHLDEIHILTDKNQEKDLHKRLSICARRLSAVPKDFFEHLHDTRL